MVAPARYISDLVVLKSCDDRRPVAMVVLVIMVVVQLLLLLLLPKGLMKVPPNASEFKNSNEDTAALNYPPSRPRPRLGPWPYLGMFSRLPIPS